MQNKKTDINDSDYLSDKVNSLVSNIGSQYGDLLLDELFRRLNNTITDFDEEINELFSSLKEHEQKKQSVIGLMKKGKTVTKESKSSQLISDWEIKLAELEGDQK
ncbi:MAG: hypothetical protein CMG59_05285 [Candidatus Marinimicrobia bacterium]|nr:hypothetical protein [Candidatus Neomarinimicrobiota bacterium]|tara:strand:+ start:495 stop:809 length:315 start_codon:yes stop_codon:yes gene_type:complete